MPACLHACTMPRISGIMDHDIGSRERGVPRGAEWSHIAGARQNGSKVIGKRLFVLLACLVVVMIGFGITLPVLPFYVERLAQVEGATQQSVVMQVALLTAVYPLSQLVVAPVWGRWSDRVGRRPVLLIGIGGYVAGQVLFGLAASLPLLYAARIAGGILSSAVLPVAGAYVADVTTDRERSRGMAWIGTATSLGFVVGPALGGALVRQELHGTWRYGHMLVDSFSTPFFAAGALGLLTLVAAFAWLPESLPRDVSASRGEEADARPVLRTLGPLLGLAIAAQFALAMFETTFVFHARGTLNFGPTELGAVFAVCGVVMMFQLAVTSALAGRLGEMDQIATGFALMGASLTVLMLPRQMAFVLALVALLAAGMALIAPNLSARISTAGGRRRAGSALGAQNAANSVGQAGGPLIGGALFAWQMDVAYVLTGVLLTSVGLLIVRNAWRRPDAGLQ